MRVAPPAILCFCIVLSIAAVAAEPALPGSGDAGDDVDTRGGAVGTPPDGSGEGADEFDWSGVDDDDSYSSETTEDQVPHDGRASTRVDRDDLERRLPRSAPDALRYEPGVYIQQTAQSQASPYIRGRTGQQTVLMFDGVRLNNSLFRQGPNQYFFTIDSATIDHIDVLRGSASTLYGSDAVAGAIEAVPTPPSRDPMVDGLGVAPRLFFDYDSSSSAYGARAQTDVQLTPSVGAIGGVGFRHFGLLRSGGLVFNPEDGELPEVPRFDDDDRTQLGTGFDEFTGDGRVVARIASNLDLTVAAYNYRQSNAPRTDQCAPPFAPFDECLKYDEQFRTVAYAGLDGSPGPLAEMQLRLSWQRQHERRTHERPSSFTINGGRDDVDTFGLRYVSEFEPWSVREWGEFALGFGGDVYHDRVSSFAWLEFTDIDIVRHRSRGQYLDGSSYTWGGLYTQAEFGFLDRLSLRAGGRFAGAAARAPGDPESDSSPVDASWTAIVGNVGAELETTQWLTLLVGLDHGFRAPNLDDLTSRQRTGPGYQLENPGLEPERALTLEGGIKLHHSWVSIDLWAYRMTLRDAISRANRESADCPTGNTDCRNAWNILQLVNVDGAAVVRGVESSARIELPADIWVQGTVAWARGDEPDPSDDEGRTPVSRIPPLNGTVEVQWEHTSGVWTGSALRWATLQDELSIGDVDDERIPRGGTPGYEVIDLRAGYRFDPIVAAAVVLENLTDAAYRTHGSSVNGPGRSILFQLEIGAKIPRRDDPASAPQPE